MDNPLVSIIIPVYNGSDFLQEAIESAINQTYENIEIIVIDDGSNDNGATKNIAISYGSKVRYLKKSNGGVSTALNLGIREMKGEYFSWLSHDDLYSKDKIKIQMDTIKKQNNCKAIIYSNFNWLDQNSKNISCRNIGKEYPRHLLKNSVFPIIEGVLHCCTLLIHKSHFERVGLFDENLITTQDYDLLFKILRNQSIIYIEKPLIYCRIHDSQGSKTIKCHNRERELLYIDIITKLDEVEICEMFYSLYNFYCRMWTFFKSNNMKNGLEFINSRLKESQKKEDFQFYKERIKKNLYEVYMKDINEICIFGSGNWGKRIYYELKIKSIDVSCFCDNDSSKWEKNICGIKCISPKELELKKDTTLVIVAGRMYEEILEQLKGKNIQNVITTSEIMNEIYFYKINE